MQYFACFSFYFYSSQPSEMCMRKIRETRHQLCLALVEGLTIALPGYLPRLGVSLISP